MKNQKAPHQPYCQVCKFDLAQTGTGASCLATKIDNPGFTEFLVKCPSAKKCRFNRS